MTTKGKIKGVLPKVELLIIGVFFLSFLAWTIPKCNSRVVQDEPEPEATVVPPADTVATTTPIAQVDSVAALTPTPVPAPAGNSEYSQLYITINKLKMRREPELKGEVIGELPLFERVYFMNEVTDSLFEINLGYETAKEPWVKIRTKKGKEGWVYGAGVNYYKKKRSGVLE